MERLFEFDKETKNTVRFQEVPVDGKVLIGPVYVQKEGLKEISYEDGQMIKIDITAVDKE